MQLLKCPICNAPLILKERTYQCDQNHQFDCAKSGYVNLLMSQGSKHKVHGDSKAMLLERRSFLNAGYYKPLQDALVDVIEAYHINGVGIDMGCGEGYYTQALSKHMTALVGLDISKDAVDLAAKAYQGIWVVGSTYQLPVADQSMRLCLSVFAPYSIEEIDRVLSMDGYFIHVYPLSHHLMSLKEAIYEKAYVNDVVPFEHESFEAQETRTVCYDVTVPTAQLIEALFNMTPYSQRTHAQGIERMKSLASLIVNCEFGISIYRKKGNLNG